MGLQPTIFVVDDDADCSNAFRAVLESSGFMNISIYESSRRFLDDAAPVNGDCVLLDVRMPNLNGLAVQEELNRRGVCVSVIIITGYAEYSIALKSIRAGAVDFIEKPVSASTLITSVHHALAVVEKPELGRPKADQVLCRLELLTPREREVFDRIVLGWPGKVVAYGLSISVAAVEMHRAHIMAKMQAPSLAALMRMGLVVSYAGQGPRSSQTA